MGTSAYIAKRNEIVKSLREVRKALRTNDTMGERIERTLDRLIQRKTIITPDQLRKTVEQVSTFLSTAEKVAQAISIVMTVMS